MPDPPRDIPLFIIGGPAGCGKSTVAKAIASSTNFPFIEGDDLHPPHNIAKMSAGHPLVDADRWDWLDKIIATSLTLEKEQSPKGIVITCSALKKSYRERMRKRVDEAREKGSKLREWFIFCNLSQEESMRRVRDRPGHYMKAGMVASQFADLEVPDPQEERVYVLDVERSIPDVDNDAIQFVDSCIGNRIA
jgi:gluconokinase